MNKFKVIVREGHHAIIDATFEDEITARAICAALNQITGVVLAGQTVVLTPASLEGALRTNGGNLYELTSLSGGIPKDRIDRRRCRSHAVPFEADTADANS